MSNNIFFISDTHFNQRSFLKYKNKDGSLLRPFSSVSEMNETMIQNWNSVVKPKDKVFHLGDVIMGNKNKFDEILSRLNGKKRLVLGNHDNDVFKYIEKYFKKTHGVRDLSFDNGFKCVLSHVPLHPNDLHSFGLNIHGHIHNDTVKRKKLFFFEEEDKRYFNVSVERNNYTPVSLEEIISKIK